MNMTTKLRESKRFIMYKSMSGMGISFVDKDNDTQTLWDTEVGSPVINYLQNCPSDEFNKYASALEYHNDDTGEGDEYRERYF